MEVFSGRIVVVVAVNIGAVAGKLTGNGTRNGPATTEFICSLALLTFPSVFL